MTALSEDRCMAVFVSISPASAPCEAKSATAAIDAAAIPYRLIVICSSSLYGQPFSSGLHSLVAGRANFLFHAQGAVPGAPRATITG